MTRSSSLIALAFLILTASCAGSGSSNQSGSSRTDTASSESTAEQQVAPTDVLAVSDLAPLPRGELIDYGPPPAVADVAISPEVVAALDEMFNSLAAGFLGSNMDAIAASGDARLAWILADVLRFVPPDGIANELTKAIETLTGADIDRANPWGSATNHLIAWDLPAPPDYLRYKRELFSIADSRWAPLFSEAQISDGAANLSPDWRYVSWGGVGIDDRPLGSTDACRTGCIPALDDPALSDAAGGDWYPDDGIIFGVEVDGEARAYPKNIMEVHEMVNDTIGGQRIAMPYCTLCGSAQAYFTDQIVMRTSGLLIRSNKMMFDLNTMSFIDTFTGIATTGPLAESGLRLEQLSVTTSTWAQWKDAHPDTTIVAQDGGLGRNYPDDPLRGRDDNGPIFPIGDADLRLPVQEPVLGVVTESGRPIAFHVASARQLLLSGGEISVENITLELDGSGLRAVVEDGSQAGSHEAFWFAWSQFQPETALWPEDFSS